MPDSLRSDLAPTGVLRASINLGNPVLAQGTADAPAGVTVDLATELAARLHVAVQFHCFNAAKDSLQAMIDARVDVCFLAIDPARAQDVAFTSPYALIEGVFAVPADSPIRTVAEVDRPGVRIGVKQGSAYDLFLSREYRQCELVRGAEGTTVFEDQRLEVAAGIREPVTAHVARHPDLRLLEDAFMQIRQAVGVPAARRPESVSYVNDVVEELKQSGFIAASLARSGQTVAVAPAAPGKPDPR